jgi:hypothetical protein
VPYLWIIALLLMASRLAADPRHENIALEWAPVIFHHESHEYLARDSGFHPVDSLVDFFFDGNKDLTDNGLNIYRLSEAQEAELVKKPVIYYSVTESRSHFYITYILYHALDVKDFSHTHDTESISLFLRKETEGLVSLEAAISNAHGYPMIYSLDADRQKHWRSRVNVDRMMPVLHALDRYSQSLHEARAWSLSKRPRSLSPHFFVTSGTHAIYKFEPTQWNQQGLRGVKYYPEWCSDCRQLWVNGKRVNGIRDSRAYRLENLDRVISSGDLKLVARKPQGAKAYLPAPSNEPVKVNLFYVSQYRTPFALSDPAKMHRFFEEGLRSLQSISTHYLYRFSPFAPSTSKPLISQSGPSGVRSIFWSEPLQ